MNDNTMKWSILGVLGAVLLTNVVLCIATLSRSSPAPLPPAPVSEWKEPTKSEPVSFEKSEYLGQAVVRVKTFGKTVWDVTPDRADEVKNGAEFSNKIVTPKSDLYIGVHTAVDGLPSPTTFVKIAYGGGPIPPPPEPEDKFFSVLKDAYKWDDGTREQADALAGVYSATCDAMKAGDKAGLLQEKMHKVADDLVGKDNLKKTRRKLADELNKEVPLTTGQVLDAATTSKLKAQFERYAGLLSKLK